jgi:hypothetical protein
VGVVVEVAGVVLVSAVLVGVALVVVVLVVGGSFVCENE